MYLRSNFGSSRLIRLLDAWAPVDVLANRQDFAERLGQWVDVTDAMALHAMHQTIQPRAKTARAPARAAGNLAVEEEFQQVRKTLVQVISANHASSAGEKGARATEAGASYAPYRKRYVDLQRYMAIRVAALRTHVRQVLSQATPALAQLAALDGVLDPMFADREQKLLSTVPVLLGRRFEHLRKQHQPGPDAAPGPAEPSGAQPPGDWLALFGKELQQLLLAELDQRLQPVAGLVQAFSSVYKK